METNLEETNLLGDGGLGPVSTIDLHEPSASSNPGAPASETSSYTPPNPDGGAGAGPFPPRRRSSSYVAAASVNGVVFNLMNAVIGVGILAMPFCFKKAGSLFSPLLLLLIGGLTERSLVLMVPPGTSCERATARMAFPLPSGTVRPWRGATEIAGAMYQISSS